MSVDITLPAAQQTTQGHCDLPPGSDLVQSCFTVSVLCIRVSHALCTESRIREEVEWALFRVEHSQARAQARAQRTKARHDAGMLLLRLIRTRECLAAGQNDSLSSSPFLNLGLRCAESTRDPLHHQSAVSPLRCERSSSGFRNPFTSREVGEDTIDLHCVPCVEETSFLDLDSPS